MNITKSQFCCLYSRTKGKLDRKKTQAMLQVRPTKHEYHRKANPRGLPTRLSPKLARQILQSTGYFIELLMPKGTLIRMDNHIRCNVIKFMLNLLMLAPTRPIS